MGKRNRQTRRQRNKQKQQKQYEGTRDFGQLIGKLFSQIVAFPIKMISAFIEEFVRFDGAGIQALGGLAFLGGVILGADSYYQLVTKKALLPWWNSDPWIGDSAGLSSWLISWLPGSEAWAGILGWGSVLLHILTPTFLICAVASLITQTVQGRATRPSLGKKKQTFEQWAKEKLPEAPTESDLEMTHIAYEEYRWAGVSQHRRIGLISLSLWGLEIVSSFNAHQFWTYIPHFGNTVACFAYACLTIVAGEVGYSIYQNSKSEE